MNLYRESLLLSISILFTIFLSSGIIYAFDDGFFWEFANYAIDRGEAGTIYPLTNWFEINDSGLAINPAVNQLPVTVQSKTPGGIAIETLNLVLTETGGTTGLFRIDHMLFNGTEFDISDTVLISVEDFVCGGDLIGNCNPGAIETLPAGNSVIISSDTTVLGGGNISIDLFETGPNTGIFTRHLTFSTISDAANAILHVSAGDIFTVKDQQTNSRTNGLISGDPNRFTIQVPVGGTVEVTATPSSGSPAVTDITAIDPLGFPVGRGGGGLVRPGLIVDFIVPSVNSDSSGGGSGCADCNPPTLGIDSNLKGMVKNGFSYNDNPVDVNLYYTPYPLVKVKVGQENKVVLKVYEDGGTQNIEHIGLGFGLAKGESFSDSKATINLDRTRDGMETVSTYDPEHVFDNVRIQSERGRCDGSIHTQCMIFTIYHTFRSPLKFDMVATYVWDFKGNAWQNYYNHGIHITGESLNPPKTQSVAFGTKEMHGLFTLTQIDIFEDKWIDEFGNIYIHMGNDRFDKIYTVPKDVILDYVTMHGCDRFCNWFESYKEHQELLAKTELEKMLFGKEITSEPKGFISSPTYNKVSRSENTDLQNRITSEIKKATELFERSFDVKNRF